MTNNPKFPVRQCCTNCWQPCKPNGDFACDCPAEYSRRMLLFWVWVCAMLGCVAVIIARCLVEVLS